MLNKWNVDPSLLQLEITETIVAADPVRVIEIMKALGELGLGLSLDDFGTGSSSLAYLRRFPIDMLKVAREFVDGLGRDAHDDVITRAIVELAGTLGLLTVAEGIETTAQQQHVAALGCDIAQGYLFSEPVDADVVLGLVAAQMRQLIARHGYRRYLILGPALAAVGMAWACFLPLHGSYALHLLPGFLVMPVGFGMSFPSAYAMPLTVDICP